MSLVYNYSIISIIMGSVTRILIRLRNLRHMYISKQFACASMHLSVGEELGHSVITPVVFMITDCESDAE